MWGFLLCLLDRRKERTADVFDTGSNPLVEASSLFERGWFVGKALSWLTAHQSPKPQTAGSQAPSRANQQLNLDPRLTSVADPGSQTAPAPSPLSSSPVQPGREGMV
ncbi:hypothetical protein SKAU_G00369490 [Synaphobranchus kaupii]|uniref:Uncharacterized protein n=1 Tax=Synaphobranchus kaupii TaxID=118154 RepID=A0A9Q1EFS8_SYNKA|nr:hypothetical protein SKAU_G00369490 [Synaphobranchus kaupii]